MDISDIRVLPNGNYEITFSDEGQVFSRITLTTQNIEVLHDYFEHIKLKKNGI